MDITSALGTAAAKSATKPVATMIAEMGKRKYDALIVKYAKVFDGHLASVRDKISSVKNLIYKDQSVGLLTQYVNISFRNRDVQFADTEVANALKNPSRFLISGTAGAGKTMFMKWCALDLLNSMQHHQMIPLYLELRDIDPATLTDGLEKTLLQHTASKKDASTYGQFLAGLNAGMFIVMLDAVDEIKPEFREEVIRSIRRFCRDYPLVPILVSTRPDHRLESVAEFSVLKTLPMTLEQILCVLQKLDFDKVVRDKLMTELQNGLYHRHESFLSNPLLATIMLLAYDYTADIPNKVTLFYKQAFEALYLRHDATKGVYKRDHHAGLPIDEFENLFSAFCYRTYVASRYEFSEGDLVRIFRSASELCGITKDANAIVKDTVESVCLLQLDGLVYIFSHRSFQEYFCALFLSRYRSDDIRSVIELALKGHYGDSVLPMFHELDPYLFAKEFLLPNLKEWINKTRRLNLETASGLSKFLEMTFTGLGIDHDTGCIRSYNLGEGSLSLFFAKLDSIFPEVEISRDVFKQKTPICSNFGEFVKSKAGDFAGLNQWDSRVEDENLVDIRFGSDAKWLIFTDMPSRMEAVRNRLINLRNVTEGILASRKTSMALLMEPIMTAERQA